MDDKFDRATYIKKALESYGYDIYSALYSHMRSGDTEYLPRVVDEVMAALVNEARYENYTVVDRYDTYFEDISAELSKRGFGAGNVSVRAALCGGKELHAKLRYMNWTINVEHDRIYALRCGRMTNGIWNVVSRTYSRGGLMVIHSAEMADLLIRLDSFYPDINKIICTKQSKLQKRMLKQKLDEAQIVAALHEAGVKKYKLFSVSSMSLCLQISLNSSSKKAQIMIPSKEAAAIIAKLEAGLYALVNDGKNELNAYIYYD